jgi:hypothetical protein
MREARDGPSDGTAIEENRGGLRHCADVRCLGRETKKPPRPEPGGLSNE